MYFCFGNVGLFLTLNVVTFGYGLPITEWEEDASLISMRVGILLLQT